MSNEHLDDPLYEERPKITNSISREIDCGCGHLYVIISFKKDDPTYAPYEIFTHLGKAGNCVTCQLEGITRSVTVGLRRGIPARVYVKQLRGIQCPIVVYDSGQPVLSCADAIGVALEEYMTHMDNDTIEEYIKGVK